MLTLFMTLSGFAIVESFNVLNFGVTSAIVYDSRLQRRSPLPGGLSFLGGLFAATVAVGIAVVLGVALITQLAAVEVTPTLRYRGELAIGVILVLLACYPRKIQKDLPRWDFAAMRRSPWVLAGAGVSLGLGQAATDVMYLSALALLTAHHPRPSVWLLIVTVIAYCAIELWPPSLLLFLATRRTARAQRIQRGLIRVITRYGPVGLRAMCLAVGVGLILDAVVHRRHLL